MPASPTDSLIYGKLFGDAAVGQLFTDTAEVRAMMLVEGALAQVQGRLGMIPETSAAAIQRAAMEIQIDPGGLAESVAANAVVVPALVDAFREAMQAPEHSAYLHWGATSQDIMDTGLALRLRQALTIIEERLDRVILGLADLAEAHAETPMVARTYGQAAVVTSFGAVVADWGRPLIRHRERLQGVRSDVELVSLSGAAGTLSVMEGRGAEIRSELAKALALSDPESSWHSTRDGIAALGAWLTGLTGSLGKIGEDLLILTQSGVSEVCLGRGGGSSTMPQKSNPVAPSAISAIARQAVGLNTVIQSALPHRQQRDGAAWLSEWLCLPQLIILTARSLAMTDALDVAPDIQAMTRHIEATDGMIFAEALTFALARTMPRPEAQAEVKRLIATARDKGLPLQSIVQESHEDLKSSEIFNPEHNLGTSPQDARRFAKVARLEK
ncbi:MAG: hypothetical protein HKN18_01840 [Silicimonas sp.]|nr:hypothetical protein [Silicimonas sp.]